MRTFVDTNVLVYLYDVSEPVRQNVVREVLLDDRLDLVISTQVLSEFFVTVTRKIQIPLKVDQARQVLDDLAELEVVPITRNLVLEAAHTSDEHHLSYWDALIIEAASHAGTDQVLTEDLAAGSTLRGVTIINPFQDPSF